MKDSLIDNLQKIIIDNTLGINMHQKNLEITQRIIQEITQRTIQNNTLSNTQNNIQSNTQRIIQNNTLKTILKIILKIILEAIKKNPARTPNSIMIQALREILKRIIKTEDQ